MAGDWRLPNLNELTSLLDLEKFDPALPIGHPFMNFQFGFANYWSSTTFADGPESAWAVFFGNGLLSILGKDSTIFVLPVRGGS
jgi:hypothetical protein